MSQKNRVPPAAMFNLIRIEARRQKPGIFTKSNGYHLAGGQSNSLALSYMRACMNTLDIVFGSDTYS